jgi:hypothetical protein
MRFEGAGARRGRLAVLPGVRTGGSPITAKPCSAIRAKRDEGCVYRSLKMLISRLGGKQWGSQRG